MKSQRGEENDFRACGAIFSLVCGWLTLVGIHDQRSNAWSNERDPAFDFLAANLTILSGARGQVIGHGRYSSSRSDSACVIRGEDNTY